MKIVRVMKAVKLYIFGYSTFVYIYTEIYTHINEDFPLIDLLGVAPMLRKPIKSCAVQILLL